MRAGVNVDIVNRQADLSKYKLVLTPDLSIMPDQTAAKLDAYVKAGGVLLADCRTGVKDERNLCHDRTLPGLLSAPLGITIEEYSSLGQDSAYKVVGRERLSGPYTAVQYTDWITPKEAAVVANYPDQWQLKSFAAVTRNAYGKGKGWYVGAVFKEDAFYDDLIRQLLQDASIRAVVTLPIGVEASIRQGQDRKLLFLINHTEELKTVQIPQDKLNVLSGQKTGASIKIDRFDVAVIQL
jgi:beta-galactosidase